jgi:hypothetical protein
VKRDFHVATHGYTNGKEDFSLKDATHTPEEKDSTPKANGKEVWPDWEDLEKYENSPIAYSPLG